MFGIQGLDIHWYALIICAGIIAGVLVGRGLAREKGYNFDMVIDLLIIALPLAIICARIYYVAFEWESYAGDFSAIIAIWNGGLAIFGGVIGAVLGAIIFCKWRKIKLGDVLDIGAAPLILGQAIGRWGNYVNQEAFGAAVTDSSKQWFPLSVYIEKAHSVFNPDTAQWEVCTLPWHQATFFYESAWNFIVFIALMLLRKKTTSRGNLFALYLALYGAGRAVIEGMRTDSLWLIPGVVRVSQALSIALVLLGIAYLIFRRFKPLTPVLYEGRYSLNKKVTKASEDKSRLKEKISADAEQDKEDSDT